MMLSIDPKHPSRRTYIVKLRSDATAEALCGRVENLVTCKQFDFVSAQELVSQIASDLAGSVGEPPNQK